MVSVDTLTSARAALSPAPTVVADCVFSPPRFQ
jgi:hypothetical protein